MKMIRKGEYDLVNISMLGFDPCTGKPFAQCIQEWRDYLDETIELNERTRWYDIIGNMRVAWRIYKLQAKQGL